ncbi:MAG: response regulator, partial [Anaerolineae bacterium]
TQPSLEGVPVVAVSAADPSVEIPRTKEMGFSGFISKPIKHNLLPKQILAIMNGEEIWGG